MEKIKAKPVSDTFWILQQNNKKVGQVILDHQGYAVSINGEQGRFKHKSDLNMIEFIKRPEYNKELFEVHGFPTETVAYNGVWSLIHKLPLFTLEANSKSLYAAGWYEIKYNNKKRNEFCPKLITLERHRYTGPFDSRPLPMFEKLFK